MTKIALNNLNGSIKVEEIDKIELSHKDWWQPKIDKKYINNFVKEVMLKLGFTLYFILVYCLLQD